VKLLNTNELTVNVYGSRNCTRIILYIHEGQSITYSPLHF